MEKGLQKGIFQGGNREKCVCVFFKGVQLISNLHSGTNHRRWLTQKNEENQAGFQLIYA